MTVSKPESSSSDNRAGGELGRCYGQIGISAVAAALPYKGEGKNMAYAPCEAQR